MQFSFMIQIVFVRISQVHFKNENKSGGIQGTYK